MLRALAVLLLSAATAAAQVSTRPPGGIGGSVFDGGTITAPILAPSGSPAAPSYSFSSATNSGFYLTANPYVAVSSGGSAIAVYNESIPALLWRNSWQHAWSGGNPAGGDLEDAPDTGLARAGGGIVRVTDGGAGAGALIVKDGLGNSVGLGFATDLLATGFWLNGTGNLVASAVNLPIFQVNSSAVRIKSITQVNWSSGSPDTTSADVGLARSAAGVVKVTDGGAGSGRINVGDGVQATPGYGFSGAAGLGLWRSAANIVLSTTDGNSAVYFAPGGVAVNSGFVFRSPSVGLELNIGTPYITFGGNTTMLRDSTAVMRFANDLNGTTLGYAIGGQVVEANATTKAPAITESGELYTNTGDADGSIINLPNDPTIGAQFRVALTVAQTVTINAATGETVAMAGQTAGTVISSSTLYGTLHLVAVTGGSGAVWMVQSHEGTWTVS